MPYSATVKLWLEANGERYPLTHTAPDWVILERPIQPIPRRGVVVVSIDGREHRRAVEISPGAHPNDLLVSPEPGHVAADDGPG